MTGETIRYLKQTAGAYATDWQVSKPEPGRPVMIAGRPARILIAEDDLEMRRLLVSDLRSEGYEVLESENGYELLEAMRMLLFDGEAVPVDLVVSDERMPGLLGTEVLGLLRTAKWPTPFLLITAFGDPQTHDDALRLGAAAVIDKPFDLDEFRETVVEALLGNLQKSEVNSPGPDPGAGLSPER